MKGILVAVFCLAAGIASAAEIKVLSGGAVEPGLEAFAHQVRREMGHKLKIQYNTAPQIAKRLASGDTYDILISPPGVIEAAILALPRWENATRFGPSLDDAELESIIVSSRRWVELPAPAAPPPSPTGPSARKDPPTESGHSRTAG